MHALLRRARGQSKTLFSVAVIAAGALTLLLTSNPFYPIEKWLLWHYLALIALSAALLTAAVSLGDFILRRIFGLCLPTHERIALALALGLTSFEIGMFLIGCAGGYGTISFICFPLALLLLGIAEGRNHLRRIRRLLAQGTRLSFGKVCFILFGCAAILLIYLSILTPANVQFDARWKHMALAEDYVAHGGLRRMGEGWVFAARPHLTSYLYVWAFSLPFGTLFHRMELCAHLEFLVFLVTTFFGLPALVRRLVPNADPRIVWVVRFLFPGVLLYDSSLSAGADHFGALLAPAIAIATLSAARDFDRRWVLLLTALLAGAIMVKETVAIMLVPMPIVLLGLRACGLGRGHPLHQNKHRAATVALAIGLGLCLTAPFWLTNIIWHKNPVYPSLSSIFPSEPWSETARYRFEVEYAETNMWSPQRDLGGLLRSAIAVFDFSLVPNDWARFHGHRPVFGSLFTLLLPLLFVLRSTKRIWLMVGWVHLALFCWYWVHHQDRYLQAVLPMMAAITASILILAARQMRRVTKVFIGSLVAVQVALGADVYFIATHAMTGSAVKRTIELLGMGYQGKYDERFVIEPRYVALSRLVPEDARILFHDMQSHLGSEREAVRDVALWQSGLSYSDARHPNDIHRWLQALGVTHIVVNGEKSTGGDRLASDLLFLDFAFRRTKSLSDVEGLHVFELQTTRSPLPFNDRAVVVSCSHGIEYSIFHLQDLAMPSVGPLSKVPLRPEATFSSIARLRLWLPRLDFLVVGTDCDVDPILSDEFRKVAVRPKRGVTPASQLFIRKSPNAN